MDDAESVRLVHGCAESHYTLPVATSFPGDPFYNLQSAAKGMLSPDRKKLTAQQAAIAKEYAWGCIEGLMSMATAVGADAGDVWLGKKHRAVHDDFEDDMAMAAALRAQPDYLVTNDHELLRHSSYATVDAQDAIKPLEL